ncbi:MAG: amidohydrolase family protein [Planctomycetes bacterium]|nr:amidohydrolase family protein [Planctomycetota bacterium]
MSARALASTLGLCSLALVAAGGLASTSQAQAAGERGGPGLALMGAKALVASWDGEQVVDHAVVLVRDGKIERCVERDVALVPKDYTVLDVGDAWLMPGMIDLHSHIGGTGDINDMVYQTNEGLRVSTAVVPENENLQRCLSAGVTSVLFIPGSGTNMGGQGILIKTGLATFEEMRIRDPGSMKVAQGDNPTRWGFGMGRSMMNYHIRGTVRRGLGYAKRWEAFERDGGAPPDVDPQFETFRALSAKEAQISTHTQIYQLVHGTIRILKQEFELEVFIDHGEWGGYLAAPEAERLGVPAIVGPREIDTPEGRQYTDGAILSCAGEFQRRGLSKIGFNTDAPVVPAEELPLQAAVSTKYGFDASEMQAVRGLTIVPAVVAKIDARVGSLEYGKDADIVVITGDPADPRSSVERVFIEGREVYSAQGGVRRW